MPKNVYHSRTFKHCWDTKGQAALIINCSPPIRQSERISIISGS
jgi:hypothetical protein